jgi:hypothetical protein
MSFESLVLYGMNFKCAKWCERGSDEKLVDLEMSTFSFAEPLSAHPTVQVAARL